MGKVSKRQVRLVLSGDAQLIQHVHRVLSHISMPSEESKTVGRTHSLTAMKYDALSPTARIIKIEQQARADAHIVGQILSPYGHRSFNRPSSCKVSSVSEISDVEKCMSSRLHTRYAERTAEV
eukprot:gnl/TRDRNA2_/TRDRNA2_117198_c0_seq1.p1 gnl/TRDRNA2_/TRDRNA2_117198_c0~~gnl/TRDRNA2_/TRDRNA2_117198_c0_seq1.p1  ORF type:complete len:123 (-),score=1.93 gnl/TRDRNA2_/TRDRNA2_117198_c0_seq1:106-474(-)